MQRYNDWNVVLASGTGGVAYLPPDLASQMNGLDASGLQGTDFIYGSQGATRLDLGQRRTPEADLRDTAPGVLETLEDGWYDTGDIVSEDENGFISIKGRAKRFAKIAGEMVSLPAVETAVNGFWPNEEHIVVKLPDAKKGEQLVLMTTRKGLERKDLTEMGKKSGLAELWVPRQIVEVDEIPLLGSGKTDYVSAEKIAAEKV